MYWRPINTAPKDQIILLCLPIVGKIKQWDRRVYEGRWHEEQQTWTSVNGFLLLECANYWMPLPPPSGANSMTEAMKLAHRMSKRNMRKKTAANKALVRLL